MPRGLGQYFFPHATEEKPSKLIFPKGDKTSVWHRLSSPPKPGNIFHSSIPKGGRTNFFAFYIWQIMIEILYLIRNCFNLSCSVVAGLSIRYKSSCLEVKKISLPGNRFAYDVITAYQVHILTQLVSNKWSGKKSKTFHRMKQPE